MVSAENSVCGSGQVAILLSICFATIRSESGIITGSAVKTAEKYWKGMGMATGLAAMCTEKDVSTSGGRSARAMKNVNIVTRYEKGKTKPINPVAHWCVDDTPLQVLISSCSVLV